VPIEAWPVAIATDIDLTPDPVALAFGLGVALLTGLVFGLVPALRATRIDVVSSLKEEGGRRGGYSVRLQRVFVAGQVGVSMVLLVAAGLFVRTLQEASQVETGFEPRGAYMTQLDLSREGYANAEEGRLVQAALIERLGRLPGVTDVALSLGLPLNGRSRGSTPIPEGWAPDGSFFSDYNVVSPGYFATLRIPLLQGRDFSTADNPGSDAVAIVSQKFAVEAWPGEEPLGRRVRIEGVSGTVVGVVSDVKNRSLNRTDMFVYLPLGQVYRAATQVVVRASGGSATVAPAIRTAILDVDPSLSLTPVLSLELLSGFDISAQRLAAGLTTSLGALALLLVGIGVYGVVALTVTRRTKEIGLRLALGADRGAVLAMIVGDGLRLVLPGFVVGGVAAMALGYVLVISDALLGVSPIDPATLLAVAVILVGVVVLASVVPARRASSVHPTVALRAE